LQAWEYFEKFHRRDANTAAQVHAYGWSGLFNGFGGKDSKLNPLDLMPFPGEIRSDRDQLRPRTRRIAIQLINENKIPPRVAQLMVTLPEIRDGVTL
jgi:hypothetical protein